MTSHDYSLLAPGPVNLHPEVRRILALPMIHHRTPEFDAVLARVLDGLKKVFGTSERVFIHSSTGSGGMESLLVNTLSPGDRVLAVVSGKFGERWAEMASVFGARVTRLDVPWGEAVDPAKVEEFLVSNPDTRFVITQACETSTAVLHPIERLGKIVAARAKTFLLVDGITAVGAMPLPMDAWHIDGLVAGSQKAFMLPAGLSFVAFSKKIAPVVDSATTPRYYFDIRREKKANEGGETFFSSAVPLLRALDWVLEDIGRTGLESLHKTIHRRAAMTRAFAQLAGLGLFSKSPSPSLTALLVPPGIDGQKARLALEKNHHLTVMGGQDQAKGKILRVGHMGFIKDEDMLRLFEAVSLTFAELGAAGWDRARAQDLRAKMESWQRTHSEGAP